MSELSETPANRQPSGRAMKPQTAARKLNIFLPATPESFQHNAVTHAQLRELQHNPPEWLKELRKTGPHPRPVVASKLGVTIAALRRNGADGPMTTEEIDALLADPPQWLSEARDAHQQEEQSDAH